MCSSRGRNGRRGKRVPSRKTAASRWAVTGSALASHGSQNDQRCAVTPQSSHRKRASSSVLTASASS